MNYITDLKESIKDKFDIDDSKASHLLEIFELSCTDAEICNLVNEGFSPVPLVAL